MAFSISGVSKRWRCLPRALLDSASHRRSADFLHGIGTRTVLVVGSDHGVESGPVVQSRHFPYYNSATKRRDY